MDRTQLLTAVLVLGLAQAAFAQTVPSTPAEASADATTSTGPVTSGFEKLVNRQATPVGNELLLYADTLVTSRTLRISAYRQLFVRSEIGHDWYRALYGGTQFFIKRQDVALLEPTGPGKAGAKKAPKRK
jgi:hypothetical protein